MESCSLSSLISIPELSISIAELFITLLFSTSSGGLYASNSSVETLSRVDWRDWFLGNLHLSLVLSLTLANIILWKDGEDNKSPQSSESLLPPSDAVRYSSSLENKHDRGVAGAGGLSRTDVAFLKAWSQLDLILEVIALKIYVEPDQLIWKP